MTREEKYNERREELSKHCKRCMSTGYPPSAERCDECTVGRRMRMLEVEYADVTGWSHSTWKTK